jgi:hypothetical protein
VVSGVPFRASGKCPAYEVNPRIASAVQAKQTRDNKQFETLVARLDAREERKQRWEDRQSQIAEALSFGNSEQDSAAGASPAAEEVPATAVASAPAPAEMQQVETAFAAKEKPGGSSTAGFFKRWIPFGPKAAEAGVGPISTEVVPAAKP